MIKKLVTSICLLFALISFAQEGTSSPYSFYGIGDVKFKGTVENRSMGGLSIIGDSIHVNLQNPASFANLKYTTYALGGNSNETNLSTWAEKVKTKRTTLDYLAVSFPVGKFGASFGVMPYSYVGYKIQNGDNTTPEINKYSGKGGINKGFLGIAYKVSTKLSLGANLDYNFGRITTSTSKFNENVLNGARELNTSSASGANITFGAMYQSKLNGKLQMYSGLTFTPQSNLNFKNTRNIATVQFSSTNDDIVIDNTDVAVSNTSVKLPTKLSLGFGLGETKKWQLGTEVVFQENSKLSNRFNDIANSSFENSTKYIVGGYFIPKYNSFTNYFDRVTYRGGFNFQNTGLVVNNKSIKEQSVSFGVGLPLGGTFSNINIGFEFGKRGTKAAGLIQENYSNLSIGLSFNDRWFVKRKYD